jgi:hypothetical protein
LLLAFVSTAILGFGTHDQDHLRILKWALVDKRKEPTTSVIYLRLCSKAVKFYVMSLKVNLNYINLAQDVSFSYLVYLFLGVVSYRYT